MHSPDLTQANIDKVEELFPTVITETRTCAETSEVHTHSRDCYAKAVDFDLLRQELSDHVVEGPQERYQLDWPGKREALFTANAPIAKTLRPVREDSVDFDTTKNVFIEGDNLDALKLLQESYLGRVKLIYIDPPYNTGSDFIYDDDFAESTAAYLERSGQVGGDGRRLVANPETSGRYHSDWLSMMYPRLKIARNLLRDDGLIAISIDENEVSTLIALCDEVLGSKNRMGVFVWEKKKKPSFLRKTMGVVTEYIVTYARNYDEVGPLYSGAGEAGKKYPINNAGNAYGRLIFPPGSVRFALPDGVIKAQDMSEGNIRTVLAVDVTIKSGVNTEALALDGEWRYSQRKLDELIAAGGEIRISKIPFRPNYINYEDRAKKTSNLLSHRINGIPTNEDATAEIRALFGADVMDFAKPTGLLAYLIAASTVDGDIVVDFFAGSSSTAHAVMKQCVTDGHRRQFVMVQLDEAIDPAAAAARNGYVTIAQLSRERIRRAGATVREGAGLVADQLDAGFRAFTIDSTNIADTLRTPDEVTQGALELNTDSVKAGRSSEDLLFQVILDWGFTLDLQLERVEVGGGEVFDVDAGTLVACFDDVVTDAVVRAIAERKPLRAVFKDSAFATDAARINTEQIFREVSPGTDVKVI